MNSRHIFSIYLLLGTLFSTRAYSQFYYRDIWTNQQITKEFAILKAEGIRSINIKSFEADGTSSEGFYCVKKIDKSYDRSQTDSKSDVTGESILITYYNSAGRVTMTIDSTASVSNHTIYKYNNKGQLTNVFFTSKAEIDSSSINEEHQYSYRPDGTLEKMIKKKGNILYSTVTFKLDENGNVIEENEVVTGQPPYRYLYYYDTKGYLTDVVHYNERLGTLLPDFMYEYDDLGQIDRMTATQEGGGYVIWRYHYNEKKLRDMERCFSQEKKLMGSIEYEYQK